MSLRFVRAALAFAAASLALNAEPAPGDLFREYTYTRRIGEIDPAATSKDPRVPGMKASAMAERPLDIPNLEGVTRAEVSIEYWGGHSGTAGQKFQVNGGDWFAIPQPEGTPTRPECYYRTILGRATVPVPLSALKAGRNAFRFTTGPQICYSFNWGFYWVYSFTVRLYYEPKTRPDFRITSPAPGAEIGDNPRLVAEARLTEDSISKVEFLANYEDFNWEGDGRFRQWHYITERGNLAHHAGTAATPPYAVTWDTTWIPDQDQPVRIAARVTTGSGQIYITPDISVRLRREGRSVRMYKTADLPEVFGVRVGRKKECHIPVDGPLETARAARLVLSTWSAAHGEEIAFNGTKIAGPIGLVHNYSFDALPIPVRLIRPGQNTFSIFSNTQEHAIEVNWPGPVLLVEYGPAPAKPAAWADPRRTLRFPLEVNGDGYTRIDKPAEIALNLPAGAGDPHVVETGPDGAVIDPEVPSQLDPGNTLVWLVKGRTGPHATRRYYAYFSTAAPRKPAPAIAELPYEGQPSFRIKTPAAVYTYHKEGAGFASLTDRDGAEWIGYHPGGRSAGEFRGIPNLGDEFAHPGHTGAKGSISRIVSAGPLKTRIVSERRDGKWAAAWDIYPTYARMTVLRNDKPYWFLYEGTPGGKLDLEHGFQLFSTGLLKPLSESWSGDLPGAEWVAFGNAPAKRVLYLVNHQDDDAPDQYWPMDGNMTVFGFGREFRCCRQYLDWSPARFTIGFAEAADYSAVSETVDSAWRPLLVRAGDAQRRGAN